MHLIGEEYASVSYWLEPGLVVPGKQLLVQLDQMQTFSFKKIHLNVSVTK